MQVVIVQLDDTDDGDSNDSDSDTDEESGEDESIYVKRKPYIQVSSF